MLVPVDVAVKDAFLCIFLLDVHPDSCFNYIGQRLLMIIGYCCANSTRYGRKSVSFVHFA